MEIIQREINSQREEVNNDMTASITNGTRLCLRWAKTPSEDILINLTAEETKRVRRALQ